MRILLHRMLLMLPLAVAACAPSNPFDLIPLEERSAIEREARERAGGGAMTVARMLRMAAGGDQVIAEGPILLFTIIEPADLERAAERLAAAVRPRDGALAVTITFGPALGSTGLEAIAEAGRYCRGLARALEADHIAVSITYLPDMASGAVAASIGPPMPPGPRA